MTGEYLFSTLATPWITLKSSLRQRFDKIHFRNAWPSAFWGWLFENIPHFFCGYGWILSSILEIYLVLEVMCFMSYDQIGHALPNLSVWQSWGGKCWFPVHMETEGLAGPCPHPVTQRQTSSTRGTAPSAQGVWGIRGGQIRMWTRHTGLYMPGEQVAHTWLLAHSVARPTPNCKGSWKWSLPVRSC